MSDSRLHKLKFQANARVKFIARRVRFRRLALLQHEVAQRRRRHLDKTSRKSLCWPVNARQGNGTASTSGDGASSARSEFVFALSDRATMPEPFEQLGGAVKHEDTIEISWQFKANLSELPPGGVILDAPAPVPLPGSWKLELKNQADGSDLRLLFEHGPLPVGAFGKSVTVKLQFDLVKGADKRRIYEDSWDGAPEPVLAPETPRSYDSYSLVVSRTKCAANGRWRTSEQNRVQQYTCSFVVVRNLQLDTAHSHYTPTADLTKAQRLAGRFRLVSAPLP